MITRRSWLVYGALFAIWIVLIGWQAAEHARVKAAAETALRHRADDISSTMALLLRGRGNTQARVEGWLNDLVNQGEMIAIKLYNADGVKLAEAGAPFELPPGKLPGSEIWDEKAGTLTLINPVELPTNSVIQPPRTNAPPASDATNGTAVVAPTSPVTPSEVPAITGTNNVSATNGTNLVDFGRRGGRRPTLAERDAFIRQHGARGFVMVMSMQPVIAALSADMWLRGIIVMLGTFSVLGYGLAGAAAAKTSELQIRLVRASELNSHLKEMNLAAAGLAHETRNPLNIVRGLAQMISKQPDASPEIRIKTKEIIDETDRVAAQLNEFINYSRPREVRRAATRIGSVVGEVARALNYDIEEKKVQLQNLTEDLVIEADEQLLRQALFNLVLNAIQAAPANGEIKIRTLKQGGSEMAIEISDNGPGIAPEHRAEIFKPYFTTHDEGTGLGLAVVQQIVLAHGWEIECLPNQPQGATFRIIHVKLSSKS